MGGERVLEAAAREPLDGGVHVVHALDHAWLIKVVNQATLLVALRVGEDQLGLAGAGHAVLDVLVDVTIPVTRDGDGALPALHYGLDTLDHDGCAEDGAVEHRADGAIGALPHLVQVVLLHALRVGGDGRALYGHAQALGGLGGVDGHLVARLVSVLKAQVIVLGLKIDVRADKLILDDLPDDAGHLVAVHLDERGLHFDLRHACLQRSLGSALRCLCGSSLPEQGYRTISGESHAGWSRLTTRAQA